MARTYGENMADSERREEESGWRRRLYNTIKYMNDLNDGDKASFDTYMSKLDRLVAEGIEEGYVCPKTSDENLQVALKNYSLKQLSS